MRNEYIPKKCLDKHSWIYYLYNYNLIFTLSALDEYRRGPLKRGEFK